MGSNVRQIADIGTIPSVAIFELQGTFCGRKNTNERLPKLNNFGDAWNRPVNNV